MGRKTLTLNLTPHKSGRFCKKIDGKLHYFGSAGSTEEEARRELIEFLSRKPSAAGPNPKLTVAQLFNEYALACDIRMKDGELSKKTWIEYDAAIKWFVAAVGANRIAGELSPADFQNAMTVLTKKDYGPYAFNRRVIAIRTALNWAQTHRWLKDNPDYGNAFNPATRSQIRQSKAQSIEQHGSRRLDQDELVALFSHEKFTGPLRTWILLGLNGGMYSVDISDLNWADIKTKYGKSYIFRLRQKTKVVQQFPIWPEVLKALPPRGPDGSPVFPSPTGGRLNRRNAHDYIGKAFRALYDDALQGKARYGIGFGALRHTHSSAVASTGSVIARKMVRGHAPEEEGVDAHYELPNYDELKVITDVARQKLFVDISRIVTERKTVGKRAPRASVAQG